MQALRHVLGAIVLAWLGFLAAPLPGQTVPRGLPDQVLTGRVVDEAGKPIAGAGIAVGFAH